jgi:nucleotide-binding universal stress UspA family protein
VQNQIVVGIDRSDGALAALGFALDEARLRNAKLLVVHAWHLPPMGTGETPWAVVPPPSYFDTQVDAARGDAEHVIAQALEQVAAQAQGVDVEAHAVEGAPAEALLEAARDAALLVVGARGRGGFRGLLLGSVSQTCVHHAPCPIVVVPRPAP